METQDACIIWPSSFDHAGVIFLGSLEQSYSNMLAYIRIYWTYFFHGLYIAPVYLSIYLSVYVYMSAEMCLHMYVCMYACMYVCMHVCIREKYILKYKYKHK